MGYNGLGIMYAKYANSPDREVADIGDKKGVVLSASSGDMLVYSDEYTSTDTIVIEARNKDFQTKVSMPLARHMRILSEVYGYDVVKAYVLDMPNELRGAADVG